MSRLIKYIIFISGLYLSMFNFSLYAENYIKIIYDVGDDIITNVDIKNQYKYLLCQLYYILFYFE